MSTIKKPRQLATQCLRPPQQLFWSLWQIKMKTHSRRLLTGFKKLPRATAGEKRHQQSTARKIFGWWNLKTLIKGVESKFFEIWGTSSNFCFQCRWATHVGSSKSTSKSLSSINLESLTSESGQSLPTTSKSTCTRTVTYAPHLTSTQPQPKITKCISLTSASKTNQNNTQNMKRATL